MLPLRFEFELEFLTPAFIGGADPAEKADFTLKPLKSAMRYWWRQTQEWGRTSVLFDNESVLFGSTRNRSPFALRPKAGSWEKSDSLIHQAELEGEFKPAAGYYEPLGSGMGYLLYSCRGCKKWIENGGKIRFSLDFFSDNANVIQEIIFSLWLAQTFGGLGSRSRRGGGSFQAIPDKLPSGFDDTKDLFSRTAEDLQESLKPISGAGHNSFLSLVKKASPLAAAMTEADHFKRFGAYGTSEDVLDAVGGQFQRFRTCRQYRTESNELFHQQALELHKAGLAAEAMLESGIGAAETYRVDIGIAKTAFGLPIVYNFKHRKSGRFVEYMDKDGKVKVCPEPWQIILKPQEHDRRASPLFLSVKRDHHTDKYYANLLALWNEFLPETERIDIVWQPRKSNKPNPCKAPLKTDAHVIGSIGAPEIGDITRFIRSL